MEKKLVFWLWVCVLAAGMGHSVEAVIPADGDLWTESGAFVPNWVYVEGLNSPDKVVYDHLGHKFVKSAFMESSYAAVGFALPAPVDLSGEQAKVHFMLKADGAAGNNNLFQVRLYSDMGWDNYTEAQIRLPMNQWVVVDLSVYYDFGYPLGDFDYAHIVRVVIMSAGFPAGLSLNGLYVKPAPDVMVPADGDQWTEDPAFLPNWIYVETQNSNPNKVVYTNLGQRCVRTAFMNSSYPYARFEFPQPMDLSGPDAKIGFWFRAEGTSSGPLAFQLRLHTDSGWDNYTYSDLLTYTGYPLPLNQWTYFELSIPSFLVSATPDLSHVVGFGVMASGPITMAFDGVFVKPTATTTVPADGDQWTEDSTFAANWIYVETQNSNPDKVTYDITGGWEAQVGSSYAQTQVMTTGYPAAGFELPTPLDLSSSRISFWFRLNSTGSSTANQLRIYTDSGWDNDYWNYFYAKPGEWTKVDVAVPNFFIGVDGSPGDITHVTKILIMHSSGATVRASIAMDGLQITPYLYTATDLASLLAAMDTKSGDAEYNIASDIDRDGEITSTDLAIVLANMQ